MKIQIDAPNTLVQRNTISPTPEADCVLTSTCHFKSIFEHTETPGGNILSNPVSETVYSRSDYDGHRWWTTWFQPHKERLTPSLIEEIDLFINTLFQMAEFQSLATMKQLCSGYAQKTSSDTEYNLYTETDHFYIWMRLITRSGDYNLYVHFYHKDY